MNQVKIGKFIADRRRKANLTQMQLAEKLNITDRAISKWETGKSLPDSSIMLELCDILGITVNDLLCGEVIAMDNYHKELENNLLEMIKQKEEKDRMLLRAEIIAIFLGLVPLIFATVYVEKNQDVEEWKRVVLVLMSIIPFLISVPFLLKIEQKAGYYKCAECGHTYVPTFRSVFFAMHMGRTRKMKCPECGRKSWQKKVLSKD